MTTRRTSKAPTVPSRWWYVLAVAIVVAGFAGMGAFMLPRLNEYSDSLMRLVAPGNIDLKLDKPGTYTVFHEQRSVVDGTMFVSDTISGLRISVRDVASGRDVRVKPASFTETYSFGSYSGTSAFIFAAADPGQYRLVAAYEDGRTEPRVVLTIGHDFLKGLFVIILGGIGIVFGSIAIAAVIIVIVAQKRSALRTTDAQSA